MMWPDNTPGQATHTANKWKNHAVANGGRRSKVLAQTYRWDADACEQGQFVASKYALTSNAVLPALSPLWPVTQTSTA